MTQESKREAIKILIVASLRCGMYSDAERKLNRVIHYVSQQEPKPLRK